MIPPNTPCATFAVAAEQALRRVRYRHPQRPRHRRPSRRPARQEGTSRRPSTCSACSCSSSPAPAPPTSTWSPRATYRSASASTASWSTSSRLPNEIGIKLTPWSRSSATSTSRRRTSCRKATSPPACPGRRIDYRVSFAPRLRPEARRPRARHRHLPRPRPRPQPPGLDATRKWQTAIEQDQGMVLVCGPTGSGKTTTLYSLIRSSDTARQKLRHHRRPRRNPDRRRHADPRRRGRRQDLLRPAPLASCARTPTSSWSAKSATPKPPASPCRPPSPATWSSPPSTRTSTVGTIFRLLDLGVEPYLIAQGLHLVLAQRLVRQLCPYCKKARVKPTPEQLAKLPNAGQGITKIYNRWAARAACPPATPAAAPSSNSSAPPKSSATSSSAPPPWATSTRPSPTPSSKNSSDRLPARRRRRRLVRRNRQGRRASRNRRGFRLS